MKNITITTILLLCAVELMAANSAITPPSSGRGGATRYRKDAGYRHGNNIMTGNVTSGKQFRGFVPYRSSSDFHGRLGSSSMDNFIKDSSGTNTYSNKNIGRSSSYYSATSSVTSMKNRKIYGSRTTRDYKLNGIVESPTMKSPGYSSRRSPRAISQVHSGAISTVLAQPVTSIPGVKPTSVKRDLYNIAVDKKNDQSMSKKDIIDTKDTNLDNGNLEPLKPAESQSPDSLDKKNKQRQIAEEYNDIFKKMKTSETESQDLNASDDNGTKDNEDNATANNDLVKSALKVANIDENATTTRAQAIKILGKHKTFASYANDKFNGYMHAARDYIKQGEYYKAADSFSLATVFRSDDPLPFAGKSLALLGAGEYMNSSLNLQKAILVYDEFPQIDVDLADMIGDKDILESRIIEIKQWQQKSDSAQLALLLSYIYLQTDHLDWAKEEIEKAEKSDSNISAIKSIKKAIEKKALQQ